MTRKTRRLEAVGWKSFKHGRILRPDDRFHSHFLLDLDTISSRRRRLSFLHPILRQLAPSLSLTPPILFLLLLLPFVFKAAKPHLVFFIVADLTTMHRMVGGWHLEMLMMMVMITKIVLRGLSHTVYTYESQVGKTILYLHGEVNRFVTFNHQQWRERRHKFNGIILNNQCFIFGN